jgi:putative DNA primase/helicase
MPMALLARDGAEYREVLLRKGLGIAPGKARNCLSTYLQTCKPKKRMTCVSKTGWYNNSFVMPDCVFGYPNDREELILQSEGPCQNKYLVKGSLPEWQREVARLCRGNSRLLFALSAAFAGPLLNPLEAEPGGFHFCGGSSNGKTTTIKVACSVWGSPDFMESWRATANGQEAAAILHNDSLLALDELGECEPIEAAKVAYMLANGVGKGRTDTKIMARPRLTWRLIYLSSGEVGLSAHVEKIGERTKGGQEVRLLEIPADTSRFGAFDDLHGFSSGREFSNVLVEQAKKFYGVAGREFVEKLVERRSEIVLRWKVRLKELVSNNLPEGSDSLIGRALQRFCMVGVSGEIATELGVLQFEQGECIQAALRCFHDWVQRRGGVQSHEERQMLSQARRFFELNGGSRFTAWGHPPEEDKTINRAGFKKVVNGEIQYFVLQEVYKTEICKGFNPTEFARVCSKAGLLMLDGEGKSSCNKKVPGTKEGGRVYVFTSKVLEGQEGEK